MRSRILANRLRERVLVNTKQGAVWDGVLFSEDRDFLVLRDVQAVGEGANRANLPMDGEILIRIADVDFIQRVSR